MLRKKLGVNELIFKLEIPESTQLKKIQSDWTKTICLLKILLKLVTTFSFDQ